MSDCSSVLLLNHVALQTSETNEIYDSEVCMHFPTSLLLSNFDIHNVSMPKLTALHLALKSSVT